MRYTTLIDISEIPAVYRNINARIVYLHLALKAGYHDDDRDICRLSIRSIAYDSGVTVSAARNALTQLQKAGLVARQGDCWVIRKWLPEQTVSPRARNKRQEAAAQAAAMRISEEQARERDREIERIQRENLARSGKNSFMIYYESMMKRAAAGDLEAARVVERNRETYDQAMRNMQEKIKKEKL